MRLAALCSAALILVDYTNAESIHKERLKDCPPDTDAIRPLGSRHGSYVVRL
jgi:hypothetical protein